MENHEKQAVKFEEWIHAGFTLYRDNFTVLFLANLIAVILSIVTLGILAGPLFAGVIIITLQCIDKKETKPEVGDLFKGFEYFLDSFLLVLIVAAVSSIASFILVQIPVIGPILSWCASIAISTLVMFSLFLIVERKMNFMDASKTSINLVKTNFLPFVAFFIVASFLAHIGVLACIIGILVTSPVYICLIAVAYRNVLAKP